MEFLAQVIMTVYLTLFLAATLLDMFYTLRGDYDTSTKNTRPLEIRPNIDPPKLMGRSGHIRSASKG
jgi:hypothetical protein|tara:strand:- start:1717 stop:1917 length:201 start_codon:yes stop_codon:yes gene_type:complete